MAGHRGLARLPRRYQWPAASRAPCSSSFIAKHSMTTKLKKLLIAYDGSPAAESAISDLFHAALPSHLDVVVMSVADVYLPPTSRLGEAAVPEFPPSLIQKAHDKALHEVEVHRGLANRACGRIKSLFPKWNCASVAVGDSPGWGIVRKATEWNADLVVVGAQSHS